MSRKPPYSKKKKRTVQLCQLYFLCAPVVARFAASGAGPPRDLVAGETLSPRPSTSIVLTMQMVVDVVEVEDGWCESESEHDGPGQRQTEP